MLSFVLAVAGLSLPAHAAAATLVSPFSGWGYSVLAVFGLAYALVFAEERLHLRKSKPVLVAAGIIWIFVALAYAERGHGDRAAEILRHNALEYAELLFFLLAAMSYINSMVERGVFDLLRQRLVSAGFSYYKLFWVTGILAFVISPIADNLTTALVMGTVVLAVGGNHRKFITGACVNIVVAANAGGAFSPFGDITTLMIWQKGVVSFGEFFALFVPSLANWLVPAALISITMPKGKPKAGGDDAVVKRGGFTIVALFLLTISGTVLLHHMLELPPFLGMMLGLGMLKVYGYFLHQMETKLAGGRAASGKTGMSFEDTAMPQQVGKPYDAFDSLREVEWDTLLFFYGIILCVGGLGAMGYLELLSRFLYVDLGATAANITIGILSAIVDNIPLTFAVLSMQPQMDMGQWLLLTLTAGTGGSLLAIGSAAGVALMGLGKGGYTFASHLKWTWAILLGYGASVLVHILLNKGLFTGG
ncbi:MAG: sodium:proton antiporter NhaD [Bdellovibrionales bacterium]